MAFETLSRFRFSTETRNSSAKSVQLIDMRQFGLAFAGLSSLFFSVMIASSYLNARTENEIDHVAATKAVASERRIIDSSVRAFAADLRVVAGLESVRAFVNGNTARFEEMQADFRNMTAGKPLIGQLRFIDSQGRERVRIQRDAVSSPVVVAKEFQDKADRAYFMQASVLPAGGVYVSAIDLNVEFGVVQEPWRPMLRLATPLYDKAGIFAGIIVVNLDMLSLIGATYTEQFSLYESLQILNAQGYWLSGVEDDRLWGFMFDRPTSMADSRPEIWRHIASERQGVIDANGGAIVFTTADPLQTLQDSELDISEITVVETWKIAAYVPAVTFADLWRPNSFVIAAAGLIVSAIFAYAIARMLLARRIAEASSQRALAEMAKNERMASLGSLVAGVAHELNTPIGISITIASTLSDRVEEFDRALAAGTLQRKYINKFQQDMREGAKIILSSLSRAAGLISHFKQVAVDQTSQKRRKFGIREFLEDLTVALQTRFKTGGVALEIVNEAEAELDSFPGLLSQVLINLIENARIHAFADDDTGTITLSVRQATESSIEIVVRDTGCGVPPKVLERIFEPFFTTRLGQGGSGLGLSISFNIVTGALGGTMKAESRVGSGTTVSIEIPVVAPAASGPLLGSTYSV